MKLMPIKIGERYMLRDDLLKMMENFISRAPRMQVTDVRARVGLRSDPRACAGLGSRLGTGS